MLAIRGRCERLSTQDDPVLSALASKDVQEAVTTYLEGVLYCYTVLGIEAIGAYCVSS